MVSQEMSSKDPKWWQDERYAIYELSVNSAAVYPEHNESLSLSSSGATYTTKGYAYSGGGRRITRVEVSLDKGTCMQRFPQAFKLYAFEVLQLTSPQLGA
jgi:nitrate reductase (NAD(P)H)